MTDRLAGMPHATGAPTPGLWWDAAPADPRAVIVIFHGGAAEDDTAVAWNQHAVLRMVPFGLRLARAHGRELAVLRVRFAIRGWQGEFAAPVKDARWALDVVRLRFPNAPIALIGHSMGGRVVLHLADDAQVSHVVGLAPWIEDADVDPQARDTQFLLLHSPQDTTTSARQSFALADRLRHNDIQASSVLIEHADHSMLRRPRIWSALSLGWLEQDLLGCRPSGTWVREPWATMTGIPRDRAADAVLAELRRRPQHLAV